MTYSLPGYILGLNNPYRFFSPSLPLYNFIDDQESHDKFLKNSRVISKKRKNPPKTDEKPRQRFWINHQKPDKKLNFEMKIKKENLKLILSWI